VREPLGLWDGYTGRLGFDIGANIGQSAAVMAPRFGRVICCEPNQGAYADLAVAYSGDPKFTLLMVAAADRDGIMSLSACRDSKSELLSPDLIGKSPDPWFSGELWRVLVPCFTVATLAAAYGVPDFVKVDTEGSEVLVLRGARPVLGQADWLVEWHSPALREECRRLLAGAGLKVTEVAFPYPEGRPPYEGEPQNGWLRAFR